jgi:PGF-pre-PGF domain-containing protein
VVTSVAPSTGPIAGDTPVNITGTNFIGATEVTIGGTAVGFSVENITSISAITPGHAAGLVYVNVTTPNGTAIGTGRYTYVGLPTVTSVAPPTGPIAGGTPITITGTNLIGATDNPASVYNVSIGDTALTNMTVVSATKIIGSTLAGTAGPVNVNITTPNGTAVTGSGKYTYVDLPTFVSITPQTGAIAGNTSIVITGSNLAGATNNPASVYNVSIGGTALTNMTVVSASKIIGSTRPGTAGLVNVDITTPNGTVTATDVFTYVESQTFTDITPSTGPIAGGNWANITGTNLIGTTSVRFGGTTATALSVENITSIIARAPAHAAGLVNVDIITPNGTATGTGAYTYVALPTVVSVAPSTGPIAGDTPVNITGTNFIGATEVTIGGTAVGFSVENITSISAITPGHAAGLVYVNVTTPNGTAIGTGRYTYVGLPTVTSVAPPTGPIAGGTPITITGTNLIGATDNPASVYNVSIGDTALTNMTVVSATKIIGSTLAGTAGPVNVNITTPNGTAVTGSGKYTYVDLPTFVSITPQTGAIAGNTSIVITGSNLAGATNNPASVYNVSIGGTALTNMTVVSASKIIGSTRPGTAGLVNVDITTPNGTVTATDVFTYIGPPTFVSIAPTSGMTTGGTTVTINGTNLIGANSGGVTGNVTIGGSLATIISVVSGSITATTPAHAAGTVDIVINTPNGTATGTGVYSYGVPPVFTSIVPTSGTTAGGTPITITGTNLAGTTNSGASIYNVSIGGTALTNMTVVSASKIIGSTPAHATGTVDAVITTPNGTATGTGAYTYVGLPTVTSVAPSTGPIAGGTPITITGTNLIGATAATFGGTTATSLLVENSTSIIATTPNHAAGTVDVDIITPNGTATGADIYTYAAFPTVTNIAPPQGKNTTTIHIANLQGTGFYGSPTVYLAKTGQLNITATNVTVASATKIACNLDLTGKTIGAWDVTVINPDGQHGSLIGGFTVTNSTPSPTVTGITPATGQNTTSVSITNLAGTGFLSGATVNLTKTGEPNIVASGVTVVSPTRITCTVNLSGTAAGPWNVVVTNPDTQTGTLTNGFTVTSTTPAPTVTSITPATGPNTTSVSITNLAGTGFISGAKVNLTKTGEPNIVASGVTVVSPTRITCLVDLTGAAAGPRNVVVTNPDTQTGTLTNGFNVTGPVPVAIFTLSPVTGATPLTVFFTDVSTNSPDGWYWDFGEGNTSTIQSPSNTYVNPGVYNVTLTATNSEGSSLPNTSVKIISVSTPINQSETTFSGVFLQPVSHPDKQILFNITEIMNAGGSVTNESSTLVDYKPPGWQSIAVTGTNVTNDAQYILADTLTSVKMTTYPLANTFTGIGTVQSQFVLDQNTLTQGVPFERVVVPSANETVTSRFQQAVQATGANLGDIGVTVEILNAAPFNANMTGGSGSVFINISVSHRWVTENGGPGSIRILHLPESGSAEVLSTTFAGGDGTTDYFTANSNTLSIFGLAGVTTSPPSPPSPQAPASEGGDTQSGQSGIGIATASGALAGQTVSYSFGPPSATYPISIQSVSFVPDREVSESQCLIKQQGPSDAFSLTDRPAAYESIDINWINPSVITSGTIHFSVLGSWLSEKHIDPSNAVLLRSHDLVWAELPTTYEKMDGNRYYYYSDTPGFSYFAVSERQPPPTAKATPQATVSMAPEVQPVSPSVTVTAITTPIQTKPAPEAGSGSPVLYPTPAPSIIPILATIQLVAGIILICAFGVIYHVYRKIPHKTPRKTRVLIVDDEPQIREVFTLILEMEGYEVISASSGEECLSLLTDKKNHPDTILLDILMYPMNGWETLETIKKDLELRKIPVLMLTGKDLLPEEAKRYGICIDDYLLKPVMPHELNGAIEYVLNRKKTIEKEILNATRAGHDKAIVCEYAKLAKRVDVERKLLELINTTYTKGRETDQEILRTIEDLADEIQRRGENLIQLQQRISASPVPFE